MYSTVVYVARANIATNHGSGSSIRADGVGDRKWRNQRKWKSNRKNSICNCARESGKFVMDFAIFARWMHTVALSGAALESNEPAARGEKSKFNVKSNLLFADALNHRRRWGAADGGEGAAKKITAEFEFHRDFLFVLQTNDSTSLLDIQIAPDPIDFSPLSYAEKPLQYCRNLNLFPLTTLFSEAWKHVNVK